jgi:hypothetical protein
MAGVAKAKRSPHITIFTRFFESTESRLEALVAYGIFTESERNGEFDKSDSYSDNIERLFASNKSFCLNEARKALLQAASTAIEEKKAEIAKEIATAHKGIRGWGIVEAVAGAAIWSIILVGGTFLAIYVKPDLIEVPKNVIEHWLQQH